MKKLLFVTLMICSIFSLSYGQDKLIKSANPIPNKYIVVLQDGEETPCTYAWQNIKGRERKDFNSAVKGFATRLSKSEVSALVNDPCVNYVEEDTKLSIADIESNPPTGLDRIDQRTLPLDAFYTYQYTGAGVKAYIIDTGIYMGHNDFGGRAILGLDTLNDGQNGNDCNGHGTHVSGIIGGTQYGVAKGVTLVSMRIFDCSANGSVSNAIVAIDWITVHKDSPSVVNMSFSFAGTSPTFNTSVANMVAKGVVVVAASGNGGFDACGSSPASTPNVLAVGATDPPSDQIWPGSNYGTCVDVLAPGLFIDSDWIGSPDAVHNDGGTSMSSPHAAGVAALYLQNRPLDGEAYVRNFIVSNATPNVVQGDLRGSPNLLLYSGFAVTPYTVPSCSGTAYDGYASAGQTIYYPSATGFSGTAGTYSGSVFIGSDADVTMALWVKKGNGWSYATSPSNPITYLGKNGTYRWSITGNSGSAGFRLCTSRP